LAETSFALAVLVKNISDAVFPVAANVQVFAKAKK
jgi:hypothetical protein